VYAFCHGERGAVTTSTIPIAWARRESSDHTRRRDLVAGNAAPYPTEILL
jgi:hypothetical protein